MSTTLKDGVMHYSQFSLHLSLFINFSDLIFLYTFCNMYRREAEVFGRVFDLTVILITVILTLSLYCVSLQHNI